MDLEKLQEIIRKKPRFFIVTSIAYLLSIALSKWTIHPVVNTVIFLFGGILGIFFLDIAEGFFNLVPSPFRSIVFFVAFICVSFFIITSSGSALASGLVLSLYLTMLLWQLGEWNLTKDLSSWYRMVALPVTAKTQYYIFIAVWVCFLILTVLLIW